MSDFPVTDADMYEIRTALVAADRARGVIAAPRLLAAIAVLERWARHGWQVSVIACDELTAEAQRLGLYEDPKP